VVLGAAERWTLTPSRFANNAAVTDQRHPGGLSSKEAAKRLRQLGPVEDRSSRSVASIVAGNVFTFFNLIIGVFFVVVLSLGLFADALFGFIAVINSYIGIRQEIKAKETLDSLALLVRWCPATGSGSSRETSWWRTASWRRAGG
jgi:magnesium-transporting ATPase (P-type)